MNASVTFEPGQSHWHATAEPRSRFERAFRRARRHSRFVRLLRFGLPASVVAALGLYGVAGWLNPWTGLSLPGVGKLVISGTRITMEVPRLAGYTRDGRSYEVTAVAAAQDLKSPQFIELKELRAKIEIETANLVNITADFGFYDTKTEALALRDNVFVKTSSGTEVRLSEASMDMRKGSVISNKPVEVDMPNGQVRANALEVVDGGALVIFRGGVTTRLNGTDTVAVRSGRESAR